MELLNISPGLKTFLILSNPALDSQITRRDLKLGLRLENNFCSARYCSRCGPSGLIRAQFKLKRDYIPWAQYGRPTPSPQRRHFAYAAAEILHLRPLPRAFGEDLPSGIYTGRGPFRDRGVLFRSNTACRCEKIRMGLRPVFAELEISSCENWRASVEVVVVITQSIYFYLRNLYPEGELSRPDVIE